MDLRKMFEKKPDASKPGHVTDATFDADVLQSKGVVLVDFWAPWCAPCRLVGGLLEEIAPEYEGRLRILKLNVDENPATAGRFGVSSIPTMILFKDGRPVQQQIGAVPLRPLRAWLDTHAAASNPAGSNA